MYNKGDVVTVRSDLIGGKQYNQLYFNVNMEKYKGKQYKIHASNHEINRYTLSGIPDYVFNSQMLVPNSKEQLLSSLVNKRITQKEYAQIIQQLEGDVHV